jgi:hypothetical protein
MPFDENWPKAICHDGDGRVASPLPVPSPLRFAKAMPEVLACPHAMRRPFACGEGLAPLRNHPKPRGESPSPSRAGVSPRCKGPSPSHNAAKPSGKGPSRLGFALAQRGFVPARLGFAPAQRDRGVLSSGRRTMTRVIGLPPVEGQGIARTRPLPPPSLQPAGIVFEKRRNTAPVDARRPCASDGHSVRPPSEEREGCAVQISLSPWSRGREAAGGRLQAAGK